MKLVILGGGAALAAILAISGGARVASAAMPDLGLTAAEAQPISDSELGGMRGKFVPSNGSIIFFGITAESTLQASDGTTETAGYTIGVNFKNGQPTSVISETLTSQQAGTGTSSTPTGGIAISVPPNNLTGGVEQTVQISGSDNQGHNVAVVDLASTGAGTQGTGFPASTPCTGCKVSTDNNGIEVSVDMPGVGVADQQIGNGSIQQAVNLDANLTSAVNTLSLQVQTEPGVGSEAGLSGILQSLPVLFH
ncbi:MAG TPA: hypothetical protein VMA09_03885 [Candidatus Binataceae bacterium]|nr:hypothetical protein [Candidatus Binataceae bacterium]